MNDQNSIHKSIGFSECSNYPNKSKNFVIKIQCSQNNFVYLTSNCDCSENIVELITDSDQTNKLMMETM